MLATVSHIARPWWRCNRRDSMLRAFVRKYACVCVHHHPPRRGMSGRTECGKPSVTIAHRDIFTPTPALSRNPSIPILHTSQRLITVTLPRRNFFLRLRQCRGLPGECARTFAILLGAVCFLSLGKSLGYCQRNAVQFARKLSPDNRCRSCAFYNCTQRVITEYTLRTPCQTKKMRGLLLILFYKFIYVHKLCVYHTMNDKQ